MAGRGDKLVDVQTIGLTGLSSGFNASTLSPDSELLNLVVEEDGEGLAWPAVDDVAGWDCTVNGVTPIKEEHDEQAG